MKKIIIILFAGIIAAHNISAQNIFPATGSAGIGTAAPNASSLLEMISTTKGLLIPRMTVAQRNAIVSPATGLMIFQTNNTPGFYYYSGTAWNAVSPKNANQTLSNLSPTAINQSLVPGADNAVDLGSPALNWRNLYLQGGIYLGGSRILNLNGNNSALGFGTLYNLSLGFGNTAVGNSALSLTTNGDRNTATGHLALYSNTTGSWNAAHGAEALYSNTTGAFNTANGFYALNKNTTGDRNTANGSYALTNNTTGRLNTATGVDAMFSNTTGSSNVANGFEALHNNTTGFSNIAIGRDALYLNTFNDNTVAIGDSALYKNGFGGTINTFNGICNTGVGSKTLLNNSIGDHNTSVGYQTLYTNASGAYNTAMGALALYKNNSLFNSAFGAYSLNQNSTGTGNTATGYQSLISNNLGSHNVANGMDALSWNNSGSDNTAIGFRSGYFVRQSYNTAVGSASLVTWENGNYNTALGYLSDVNSDGLSNATAIGYGALAFANDQVMLGNTSVKSVWAAGNYVIYSDGRFKKNLKENVPGLDFINQLKPVTYNYDIHKLNDYIKPVTNAAAEKDKNEKMQKPSSPELEKIKEDAITAKEKKIYTGFIAQDVEKVADKMGYDFSGVYKPQNDKDPYGLSYADFVVPLVKAVQELSKANDALQQQNTDLEKRMQQLEAMMNVQSTTTSNAQTVKINNAALEQNIPNPFNHSTTINYTLPQQCSNAKIVITDNAGKSLKEINITGKTKGSVTVDASSLSSGTYYYSLYADGKMISSKQMVLAK